MRLLVVEDDPKISRFLLKGLREEQHLVDLAETGPDGEASAMASDYDAIILDLMLPGADGFEVCRRIRAQGNDAPILIVTARGTVADRVRGLDTGADDFLVKPFAFDELLARLRALTRRGRPRGGGVFAHGPLTFDPVAHEFRVNGRALELTATEYRLLEYLIYRPKTIVSRAQLAEHVWGGDYDPFSNVADVYVGYLRKKLSAAGAPDVIHTVRGLGYRLDATS